MTAQDEITRMLQVHGGVLVRSDHPELAGSIDWLLRNRVLRTVLPGVYAEPARIAEFSIRVQAVARRQPGAVILTSAAARLTYWPECVVREIEVAVPGPVAPAAGYRFTRRRIPPELVWTRGTIGCTAPELTAVDLAHCTDGESIDRALRARAVTLDGLHVALTQSTYRAGNKTRRRVLLASRDEPWSAAERRAHGLLRAAGIVGWRANHPVRLGGKLYFIDIAFPGRKLAIEIDGRIHEDDLDLFESDRNRQNELALGGWIVLRFTWAMLRDNPELVVARIQAALRS